MTEGRRRGRWILAGGIVGLALSPGARRLGMNMRAHATRLGHTGDPQAPFRAAPCYEHDRTGAADAAHSEAAH